jgi:hypothetical protein
VHPATDQLIKLSDSLRGWGRGLVIVEGPDALQRFGEEEDPKAVLEDLAQSWPEDLDLLVLLIPGELPENPNLRMLSAEDLVDLGLDRTDPGDA